MEERQPFLVLNFSNKFVMLGFLFFYISCIMNIKVYLFNKEKRYETKLQKNVSNRFGIYVY